MELKIGASIKRLRANKNVTQEQLADYLGVSFQAVSKWETDATTPDIALLPRLATYFGVSIDTLFAADDADKLTRVERILYDERQTDEGFAYATAMLADIAAREPDNVRALKLLAVAYHNHASALERKSTGILRRAIELSPLDYELFDTYLQAVGAFPEAYRSAGIDVLTFFEPYALRGASQMKLRRRLAEIAISLRQFVRAERLVAELDDPTRRLFKGDMLLAHGDETAARETWLAVAETNADTSYQAGERFEKIGETDDAIACYERSFALQSQPRELSALYSLAFLYTRLGQRDNAIAAWKRIADVLRLDWGKSEGDETLDWPLREIAKLRE